MSIGREDVAFESLTISEHHDERHLENIRQPLGQHERHHVTNMHGIATRPAASIDKERFIPLILVQDYLKIAMRKDNLSPQKTVRFLARDSLKPLQQGIVNELGPELID